MPQTLKRTRRPERVLLLWGRGGGRRPKVNPAPVESLHRNRDTIGTKTKAMPVAHRHAMCVWEHEYNEWGRGARQRDPQESALEPLLCVSQSAVGVRFRIYHAAVLPPPVCRTTQPEAGRKAAPTLAVELSLGIKYNTQPL